MQGAEPQCAQGGLPLYLPVKRPCPDYTCKAVMSTTKMLLCQRVCASLEGEVAMPWMPDRRRCVSTNKAGQACQSPVILNRDYCWIHDPAREAQRLRVARERRGSQWAEPSPGEPGRWISKVEAYIRSRGYIHTDYRWRGQTNIRRLSRETGILYGNLYAIVKGRLWSTLGMETLGRLCGHFGCGPSDLIEWEVAHGDLSREALEGEYVSPAKYREGG